MKLNKLESLTSKLPEEQRNALLELIDLKTEQDMKEVINVIKNLETKNEAMFKQNDSMFKHLEAKNDAMFKHNEAMFKQLETKNDAMFKTVYWILGGIVTLIVALKLFA